MACVACRSPDAITCRRGSRATAPASKGCDKPRWAKPWARGERAGWLPPVPQLRDWRLAVLPMS
eukprot:3447570-Lingulodinium_polyedra.AAC.1